MFILKEYQNRVLEALKLYYDSCNRIGNADTAFYEVTRETFGSGIPFRQIKELPGLPYVCLRIPTGGGKTLVACHSLGITSKYLLQTEYPLVLWLVPSNTIREQTINALKNRKHPYRQALEASLGPITVLGIQEALYLQKATLDTQATIIVSTMQAFRVEDTDGRKVYDGSGALMSHFTDIPEAISSGLERNDEGIIIQSLANVLRIRRPIVIVDEAHNARTSLSFETLARFNPSCILEFTATPDTKNNPSNILYSVSARELKAEAMIKLPIRLETKINWKELLSDAIGMIEHLELIASNEEKETGEYIRPIMLIQAQPKYKDKDSLTVEVVRDCLINDHNIHPDKIARATGTDREIEGIDILSKECPIQYIITVQALREGWDCPFAYILCSIAEMSSNTAVEQILGRIMRLPKARFKKHGELNMAYAFAASAHFSEAANALTDALIQNGFEKQEAEEMIAKASNQPQGSLFDEEQYALDNSTTIKVTEIPETTNLSTRLQERVSFNKETNTITFKGVMSETDREELLACFNTQNDKVLIEQVYTKSRGQTIKQKGTPAERGEPFSIPVLAVKRNGFFEQFEQSHFLDVHWQLSNCNPTLSETDFASKRPEGQHGEITVTDEGKVKIKFISSLQGQMQMLASDRGWRKEDLVIWLDRTIHHPDITSQESTLYLSKVVRHLIDERGLSIEQLVLDKYRLRKAVEISIEKHRRNAILQGYQTLLFGNLQSEIVVNPNICFSYSPHQYPCNTWYRGKYAFQKHYYPVIGDLNDKGEEFECAQFIDTLPEIKYWVRNLERRPNHSFWLQTSTDKFYPDFVCLLNDGRYLVVEYKGEDRWSNDDSKEKRDIGTLWEAKSNGECLFVMPKGKDITTIKAKIGIK